MIYGYLLTILLFIFSTFAYSESWNDVSRLNPESVSRVINVQSQQDIVDTLKNLTKDTKLTISGTRHSQGGHIVYPDGIVLDMTSFNKVIDISPQEKLIRVQSGATWQQVQQAANQHGLAVKVMQSSNIFSIGGSLSANVHGRDPRFGPIIETVRSIKMALANGEVVEASRTVNSDLFMAAIGGYGLLGVIIEAEIELTSNLPLKKYTQHIAVSDYAKLIHNQADELQLHYGRCSFSPGENFLTECYSTNLISASEHITVSELQAEKNIARNAIIFNASRASDTGKAIRWWLQKQLLDKPGKASFIDRNPAMQPDIRFLQYDSSTDTDILQEYFVPINAFPTFLTQLKITLEKHNVNLLSITLRYLRENHESYLSYATDNMIAIVIYVNIELNQPSIQTARAWTRELVDLALQNNGTYYLTYQGFPTLDQFEMAYPDWSTFMTVKCKYDPTEVFSSQFYQQYLKAAYRRANQSDSVSCSNN